MYSVFVFLYMYLHSINVGVCVSTHGLRVVVVGGLFKGASVPVIKKLKRNAVFHTLYLSAIPMFLASSFLFDTGIYFGQTKIMRL